MNRRLLSLAGPARSSLTIAIIAGTVSGWLIISQAYLVSSTISRVFVGHQTVAQLTRPLAALLIVVLGRGVLTWIHEASANRIAQQVKTTLRMRLMRHLLALGPTYAQNERTGELTASVIDGVESLDAYFSQYLPQLIIGVVVPASILLVVLPLDPLSGLLLLVTAPLIPFFMYMIGRGAGVAAGRQHSSLGKLSAYFLDSLQGLTTLKAFGQSKAQARNIANVSDEFRRLTLKVMETSFLSAFALELLATISTAMIAVEVGLRLLYSQMQFGEALFLLVLAPEFYLPLRLLGQRFHAGLAGRAASSRIFQILDTPSPSTSPCAGPGSSEAAVDLRAGTIELRGVSFSYPGRSRPALQEINLIIQPGQHIALVGATGAGKSTLASLLLGFMVPTSGRVSLHLDSGQEAMGAALGQFLSWVPQHPHLLHDTIAANIRMGAPQATAEGIAVAARQASLDQVIETLPDKYETVIGERGARLSSGEAQRLALARAFVRRAPILILDEPTSSLDPENEALLEESTRQLMMGRTVITIAHRLNTVFRADCIVVLREGRIVESGTHSQLLAAGGEYNRLVDAAAGAWLLPSVPAASTGPDLEGLPSRSSVAPVALMPRAVFGSEPDMLDRDGPRQPTAGVLHHLLSFLHGSWGRVSLSVVLGTLTIASSVALMGTSAWLISMAGLHPSIAVLGLAIVGVRLFGIARAVFRYLERLVTHSVTLEVLRNLRVWVYERLEPLAPARLMQYMSGDLLGRIVADVETLEHFFVRIVAPPLVAAAVVIATGAFLAAQVAPAALPFLASALLVGLVLPIVVHRAGRSAATDLIRSRAETRTRLLDTLQGMADVVAFGLRQDRLDSIVAADQKQATAQTRLGRLNAWHAAAATILTGLALWTLLLIEIPLVAVGQLDVLMLAPLALITSSAFEAVAPLPVAGQWWNAVLAAAGRLFDLVDVKPAVSSGPVQSIPTSAEAGASARSADEAAISFRDVSFTYPGQATPALQHLTLDIPAVCGVGIVGPSGGGKSSLVNLLMRFWDYDSGEIFLQGVSLPSRSADQVRELIGWVAPSAHFFDTSIRENLRMAGRHASRQQIERAAQDAQIHEFICGLPAGYDTLIGEHGLRLSAGERQRLAIARVLIKDAPFLILDEPTANLDPLTERMILTTLFQLMKGRPSLLVTHRLVGLENLARIMVLDRGAIVEHGTHAELLAARGTYRRLWDLQNRIWASP